MGGRKEVDSFNGIIYKARKKFTTIKGMEKRERMRLGIKTILVITTGTANLTTSGVKSNSEKEGTCNRSFLIG